MSDPNKALAKDNNTVRSFLTALALNGALLFIQVGAFLILKSKLTRIYAPRVYLPPSDKRAPELPRGPWRWLPALFVFRSSDIIRRNGLDAYMAIRFFLMMIKIFGVFTLVTWPILLPVNAAGMPIDQRDGLGRLAFGNISKTHQHRYWAHLLIVWVLNFYVLWLIHSELLSFVHLRSKWLSSHYHSKLAQAKTVLITSLPKDLSDPKVLKEFFSFIPGGVTRVWIYRNHPVLPQLFNDRKAACLKLEKAATTLLETAIKAEKKNTTSMIPQFPLGVRASKSDRDLAADMENAAGSTILDNITRPTHRLSSIPCMGERVDTIHWCTQEISRLNKEISEARKGLDQCEPHGSAFVQCEYQIGAHVLAQCVSYHEPLFMSQKWIEVSPEDVIWANIDDGAYEVRMRFVLSWAATLGLIILWGFPVAFAGIVSNVDQLCSDYPRFSWVCRTPKIAQGIIQGVLPPLFLAILFLLLPYLLQGLAWYECIPRYSLISISVYKRYFMFLVIHGFLIITVFSSLSTILDDVSDPRRLVQNLAIYLPDANVFFLTYMVQQGFMGAAGALLQAGPLILFFIKRIFFGDTPREAYTGTFSMPSFDFGVMLPRMSLLATIGIAYSVIAPIINGLAIMAFALFWISWKFLFIWVLDQPDAQETGGLYFPLLVSNLFTGLYIQHLCLAGLFFLATDENGTHTSIAQGVLMIVLIIITALAQIFFHNTFDPVTDYLAMSIAREDLRKRYARNISRAGSVGVSTAVRQDTMQTQIELFEKSREEPDLFSRDRMRSVVRRKLRIKDGRHHGHSVDMKEEAERKASKDQEKKLQVVEEEMRKAQETVEGSTSKENPIPRNNNGSKTSINSKDSKKEKSKVSEILSSTTAANVKMDAPAKRLDNDDDSDTDDDLEEHAFDHPSTYEDQRWIWIPKYEGNEDLSASLVKELQAAGVDASDLGAFIDSNGTVTVTRNPPDEDWSGGQNV